MDFGGSSGDATFDTFYMPHRTVKSFGHSGYGGTTVRFDDYEDFMWTGTKESHLASYVGPHMKLYSPFGHLATGGIVDYCITEAGVFTVGLDRLSLYRRDGFELLHQPLYTVSNGEPLSCCLAVRNNVHILPNETVFVAGSRGLVRKVNLQRPEIVENLQVGTIDTTLMRSSDRFVCFGSSSGDLGILDIRSNQVRTHKLASDLKNMVLWDFDVHDYSLFLCADELNDDGSAIPSNSILCYDLRICKATAPIITALCPRYIRVLPDTCGQKCIVVDQMEGKYQLISSVASASTEKNVCRISKNCSVPVSLEVSSTGQEIAIADDTGSVHVLRSAASAKSRQWNKTSLRLLPSIEVVHRQLRNNEFFQTQANVAPGFADATVSTVQPVASSNNRKSSKQTVIRLRENIQSFISNDNRILGGSRSRSVEYIPHSSTNHLGRSVSDLGHLTSPRYFLGWFLRKVPAERLVFLLQK